MSCFKYKLNQNNIEVESTTFKKPNYDFENGFVIIKDDSNEISKKFKYKKGKSLIELCKLSSEQAIDDLNLDYIKAIYTDSNKFKIGILSKTYAPLFLYSKDKNIICAIYINKDTTIDLLVKKVIETLKIKENINPQELIAIFAPGVSFSNINITSKERAKIDKLGYLASLKTSFDIIHFDVTLMNYMMLIEEGLLADNIILNDQYLFDDYNEIFEAINKNQSILTSIKLK